MVAPGDAQRFWPTLVLSGPDPLGISQAAAGLFQSLNRLSNIYPIDLGS